MPVEKDQPINIWEIYNDKLINMSKIKKNFHTLNNVTPLKGKYPNCGDEIELYLELSHDKIKDISFKGELCMISTASTNYMIDTIKGKTIDDAVKIIDEFIKLMKENKTNKAYTQIFQNAQVFEKVNKLHGRINCVLLPWNTVKSILNKTRCY